MFDPILVLHQSIKIFKYNLRNISARKEVAILIFILEIEEYETLFKMWLDVVGGIGGRAPKQGLGMGQ